MEDNPVNREKILFARPTHDGYLFDNDVTVWGMFAHTITNSNYSVEPHFPKGSNLAGNRCKSVDRAREWGCKYIMWIDSDSLMMKDTCLKLLAHDLPIVSAVYVGKQPPFNVVAGRLGKNNEHIPANDLLNAMAVRDDLDWVGFGAILIKTEVFDKLEPPYFADAGGANRGEDMYFCLKAKAAGFKINVDPNTVIGHVGFYGYTPNDTRAYMAVKAKRPNVIRQLRGKEKKALLVNPQGKVLVP